MKLGLLMRLTNWKNSANSATGYRSLFVVVLVTATTLGVCLPAAKAGGPFGVVGGIQSKQTGGFHLGFGQGQVRQTNGWNLPTNQGAASRGLALTMTAPTAQAAAIHVPAGTHTFRNQTQDLRIQRHLSAAGSHRSHSMGSLGASQDFSANCDGMQINPNVRPGSLILAPPLVAPSLLTPNLIAPNLPAGSGFFGTPGISQPRIVFVPVEKPPRKVLPNRLPPKVVNVLPNGTQPHSTTVSINVPKNEIRSEVPQAQPAVTPATNAMAEEVRHITAGEMKRAIEFFGQNLEQLCNRLEERIPNVQCDRPAMFEAFASCEVPSELQIRIVDLLEVGDYDAAEKIWRRALPKCRIPFHPCESRQWIVRLRACLADTQCVDVALQNLMTVLPTEYQPTECCGADTLLAQLKSEAEIYDAFVEAATQVDLENAPSGWEATSPAAEIPTGLVEIVQHPGLQEGTALVVSPNLVMTGTSGFGAFRKQSGYVAEALGNRVAIGSPVLGNVPGNVTGRSAELVRSGVLLMNPTTSTIHFVIDGRQSQLLPGARQVFASKQVVEIVFDRGGQTAGSRQTHRYQVTPKTYAFKVLAGGIDLVPCKFEVTLDSQENSSDFHYVVQGQPQTLCGGKVAKHVSNYPLLIEFDRGNGLKAKQVLLEQTNVKLQVAVNAADNLWDLFTPASPFQSLKTDLAKEEPTFVPAF